MENRFFIERARIIQKFGAAVIAMAFDEDGQADTLEWRIEICERSYRILVDDLGYDASDVILDPNIFPVATGMVLQGDARKPDRDFKPEEGGHAYASELLEQVVDLNRGIFLDDELEQAHHSDFCIGVSGYPEKHMAAPNLELDMKYLKQKVDKGADYIVTQMFFDTQKYIDFVTKCREMDINIPIVPGLKPITSLRQLTILPQIFHIDLPYDLSNALEKAKNNDQAKEIGIEWAIQQSKELIEFGVPTLHYYSMGKSESVYKVAREVF